MIYEIKKIIYITKTIDIFINNIKNWKVRE
jgi:hypothetical protein